jgi:hypothetical protein
METLCCLAIVRAGIKQNQIGARAENRFYVRSDSGAEVRDTGGGCGIKVPVSSADEATALTDCKDYFSSRRVE